MGYAHNSVVPHISGGTTGAGGNKAQRSAFSVYLGYRNKLHFVRDTTHSGSPWTVLVSFLRTGEFLAAGSTRNFVAANRGLMAGLRGETGRPQIRLETGERLKQAQRVLFQ